jgi:hypothetical protein
MKERAIQFSAPMVCALLNGNKTQTRRMVKPQPQKCHLISRDMASPSGYSLIADAYDDEYLVCRFGVPGDRLWVQESFYCDHCDYPDGVPDCCQWREVNGARIPLTVEEKRAQMLELMFYRADGDPEFEAQDGPIPWHSSTQMPRWASRITLEITNIRIERLQDITEADAAAEGARIGDPSIIRLNPSRGGHRREIVGTAATCRRAFETLWESIKGPGSWDANPWVWVFEFKRVPL